MKTSPFPGVDPYLEPYWSGVPTSMISIFRNQVQEQLPEGLWADVEGTVTVEGGNVDGLLLRPDVGIFDQGDSNLRKDSEKGDIAVAEPIVISEALETIDLTVIIIDTTSGDRVVTAIEMLSPANKIGLKGRNRYETRRNAYISGGANLVEIDLLRNGGYILGAPEHRIPPGKHSIISVWRRITLKWEVYPVALGDPLPNFRVPLRSGDRDIILRLQEAFDDNYVNGAYSRRIDYSKDPSPKLSEEDAKWAKEWLQARGLR